MTTNAKEFRLGIAEFIEEADERRKDLTKVIGLRALSDVVLGTRVDTGRARGNWQVAESTPPQGYDPNLGAPEGRSGKDAPTRRADPMSAGASAIDAASGDDVIWIHNGVPYIQVLEDWDAMVEGAYEAARTYLRSL